MKLIQELKSWKVSCVNLRKSEHAFNMFVKRFIKKCDPQTYLDNMSKVAGFTESIPKFDVPLSKEDYVYLEQCKSMFGIKYRATSCLYKYSVAGNDGFINFLEDMFDMEKPDNCVNFNKHVSGYMDVCKCCKNYNQMLEYKNLLNDLQKAVLDKKSIENNIVSIIKSFFFKQYIG